MRSEKVAMEDRLSLRATAPWLSVPSALMLASNGRNFEIQVGAAGFRFIAQHCYTSEQLHGAAGSRPPSTQTRSCGPHREVVRPAPAEACQVQTGCCNGCSPLAMRKILHPSFHLAAQVSASELPEGLHYAEVIGEDSSAPWRGPLFRQVLVDVTSDADVT